MMKRAVPIPAAKATTDAERSKLLESVSIYNSFTNTLRAGDRVERIRMSAPTSELFGTLGVTPMLGRTPVAEDEDRAVVISHELWATWFGSDSSAVGRTVEIFNQTRTIIGVMGPEFAFPIDGSDAIPEGIPRQLGDVILCPQVVGAEWRRPLVHGLLHLLGHDHGPAMERREGAFS